MAIARSNEDHRSDERATQDSGFGTRDTMAATRSGLRERQSRFRPGMLIATRYRLEHPLGQGAMGEVWRARHEELNTDVAIKLALLEPEYGDLLAERFRLEAQVSAQLSQHTDHIVAVHDAGRHQDVPYLVMEHVAGKTLEQHIDAGALPQERVADVIEQVAEALDVAHNHGIWHRDIKSANLMVVTLPDGRWLVKVADFGVAKSLDDKLEIDRPKTTMTGSLVGTPAYMSPEQIAEGPPSAQSDLWSLAVTAYEALTGRFPFDEETVTVLLGSIVTKPAPPVSSVIAVSPALDLWFDKALAKDPRARFGAAREMAAAFREALAVPPPPPKKRWIVPVVSLTLAGAVAVIGVSMTSNDAPAVSPPDTMVTSDEPAPIAPSVSSPDPQPVATPAPAPVPEVKPIAPPVPIASPPVPVAAPLPTPLPPPTPLPTRPKPYNKDETQ